MHITESAEFIIAEPVTIIQDDHDKKEYRVYVAGNVVSSISRYTDYIILDTPQTVIDFAREFVLKNSNILPPFYVLDIMETTEGLDVVELNGITASGRYEGNNMDKFILDTQQYLSSNEHIREAKKMFKPR